MVYLMLWYAQVVYCNKIEDHIAKETWLYLISRIEISRVPGNANQDNSIKSKSERKDILKSVHGNNKKLKRLEEWLPNDAWQNIIELSQKLREFYHLPQSILDNDEFVTKLGSVYSWKAWWRDCNSILKSEKYSQIGIRLLELEIPPIPSTTQTNLTQLVLYTCLFPHAAIHIFQAIFELDSGLQQFLNRNEKKRYSN